MTVMLAVLMTVYSKFLKTFARHVKIGILHRVRERQRIKSEHTSG